MIVYLVHDFCCMKNIVCLMVKILAFKNLIIGLKISMQRFFLSNTNRNWLKEAEVDRKSGKSMRSKSSRHSKSTSGLSSSSLKSRLAEEQAKLAEIAAEGKYVEKKQELQHCAEKLEIEEKLGKAEARLW